jgi:phage protein D
MTQHVPQPTWRLWLNQAEVTTAIAPAVLSVVHSDRLEQSAAEVEVRIEDSQQRWQQTAPTRGDTLRLDIGYDDHSIPCGLFELDEIETSGPPDVMTLKAISAGINQAWRTRVSRKYEGQSLFAIATTIAKAHGVTVVGVPRGLALTEHHRLTQKHETDLQFLRRVANLYNYSFSVRGTQLVFLSRTELEQQPPVAVITRQVCLRFSFGLQAVHTYKSATVSGPTGVERADD